VTVELVSAAGEPIGSASVQDAHLPPGRLHRAFSIILFDHAGRTLLQRRAAAKSRFGGLWSNTCCSHPAPGAPLIDFAVRRLGEELGLPPVPLREVGRFSYRAADEVGGWVEHEYDHVLVGTMEATDPEPDPAEVDQWRWVSPAALSGEDPASFTPWFGQALTLAISSQ
jgi:isopentenyl-diphosphate Delta-isomerase